MELKKIKGTKLQLGHDDDDCDFNEKLQDAILNKSLVKNLNDKAMLTLSRMLETLNFNQYNYAPTTFFSENMRYIRDSLPGRL